MKYAWINKHAHQWPVRLCCHVLEIGTSGYFEHQRRKSLIRAVDAAASKRSSSQALLVHMRAIHAEVKSEYGWPRMHKELAARGIPVGKKRVRNLMKHNGIKARGKRKFIVTTNSNHKLPIAPNLLERDFTPEAKDRVWSGDITYIWTDEGWLYLAAVIDLFSRRVMGWSMKDNM